MHPAEDCGVPPTPRSARRSAAIRLTFLHGLVIGAAGCTDSSPVPDPCEPELYDALACERAVAGSGYYYRGAWIPRLYPHPFLYYGSAHDEYVAKGGRTVAAPSSAYSSSYRTHAERAGAVVDAVTPEGTRLSPSRMSAIGQRGGSFASARTGATASRGGFGSTGVSAAVRGG